MTDTTTHVPLNKLVAWEGNVRKTASPEGLQELAASIAAHGLLQSLVVRQARKGKFAVVAGNRRLIALLMLSAQGRLADDHPVPCQVLSAEADATEISLAENAVREQMHPADEFEAFAALAAKGTPAADIAARFGVTETVVLKRLKLARVSSVILAAYRADDLTLEEVMAFAVTDDHAAQDRVFKSLGKRYGYGPGDIRASLTEDEVSAADRRVKFVTLKAYEKAGGTVRRDLFANDEDGVFIDNLELLDQLVEAKLEKSAKAAAREGWKWVETRANYDYSEWGDCMRRYEEEVPLSAELQAELDALSAEHDQLYEAWDGESERPERLGQIDDRMTAIGESQESVWTPETLAIAGAVVYIGPAGKADVNRGLVLPADKPKKALKTKTVAKTDHDGNVETVEAEETFTLSRPLQESLSRHRSAALTATLIDAPDVALSYIVHSIASQVLYGDHHNTCMDLTARDQSAEELPHSTAADHIGRARSLWLDKAPGDPADLLKWCLNRSRDELIDLLTYCAAATIDAVLGVGSMERIACSHELAATLKLDMADWFKPTAENYFGKISKAGILQALQEGRGSIAPAWGSLKKSELAALAERELAETRWLPEPLRFAEPEHDRLEDAA